MPLTQISLLPTKPIEREEFTPVATNQKGLEDASANGAVHPFHRDLCVEGGVLQEECASIMKNFFRKRRMKQS